MANVGVLIEMEDGKVKGTNYGVLSAAGQAGAKEIFALLLEGEAEAVKDTLATYGARNVVRVQGDGVDLAGSPDLKSRALADAVKHFELDALLGLASAPGRDIFARLAALLDVPMVADCLTVNLAEKTVQKSHFSGKTLATIRFAV